MATQSMQREAVGLPPEVEILAPSALEILESAFHNPRVGTLQDAGAKLSPDVIVIKVEA